MELGLVQHVSLQGGQEDLRSVAEDNDSQSNGKGEDVNTQRHLGPAPRADVEDTVAQNDCIDDRVNHTVPKTQARDCVQILEECTG